ncbi:hypothetical protein PN836_010130 [Ningiella sp. W23]|uniref:hypothetical protein n=1 Tax=Ningiella sp. W23 TaxID=3023715 RepID=UPI003757CE4D
MTYLSILKQALLASTLLGFSLAVSASPLADSSENMPLSLTSSLFGYAALAIFVIAYIFVILEEKIHLSKSKPVLLAAGLIWNLIAIAYQYSSNINAQANL